MTDPILHAISQWRHSDVINLCRIAIRYACPFMFFSAKWSFVTDLSFGWSCYLSQIPILHDELRWACITYAFGWLWRHCDVIDTSLTFVMTFASDSSFFKWADHNCSKSSMSGSKNLQRKTLQSMLELDHYISTAGWPDRSFFGYLFAASIRERRILESGVSDKS